MALQYTDEMTGEEYNELRLSVEWRPITEGQAERGLAHTTFLVAAKDKEPFYEKFGFKRRPNEFSGDGMSMWRKK